MPSHREPSTTYDQGYAWVVLAASFVSHFIIYGITWSVGVFYVMILNHMDNKSSVQVGLIISFNTGSNFASAAIAGVVCQRYGCRIVALIGGAVSSLGLVLSGWATNVYHLYITFGVITGFGFGFAYIPAVVIVGSYFSKYRSVAFGVAVSGVGLGTFVFPPLLRHLEETYHWKSTFFVAGALCLQMVITGALYRPNYHPKQQKKRPQSGLYLHLFKDSAYTVLSLHSMFTWFGLTVIYMHLPPYALSLGYTSDEGAALVSIIGISNLIGRLGFGCLNSFDALTPVCLYSTGILGAGLCAAAMPLVDNYIWMASCAAGFGLLWSTFGPMFPEVIMDILEPSLLSVAYGYTMIFMAIGTLVAGPLSGFVLDVSDFYPGMLYLGGGALIFASFMMILPWKCANKLHKETLSVSLSGPEITVS